MTHSQHSSFEEELKNSVSVVELEQRLEMVQAFGFYCCEYGEHPGVQHADGTVTYTSCGSL